MKWETVKLCDVSEIIAGQSPESKYYNNAGEGVPFFQGKADFGDKHPSVRYYCTMPTKMARPNDVLLSVRAPVGPTNICNIDACIGRGLAALRASNSLDHNYLNFYLKSIETKLAAKGNGSTFAAITTADVKNLPIPLPPLEEQKRIAAILDKADELRRKDEELLRKYNELAQAIFIDMFGDPVKNEKGWEIGTIRDIATEVKYGTSKPSSDKGKYKYIRMNNITFSGDWDFCDLKHITITDSEKHKYTIKNGDLVFNRTNSKELVGKTAVYDQNEEMIIAGYLIRVRFNDRGNPYYVSGFLNSKPGKAILRNMCKDIIGMANINAQELQDIQLAIPPIAIQNDYQKTYKGIKKQKETAVLTSLKSENLFQSLLQKAFSGQL